MALNPTDIQKAYVAFFNRPADVAGLTYWSTYAGNSSDLLNTFAKSAEYNALYSGLNNTQLVNAIYQNLFGRSPDVDGLNYWVNQLDSGKVTIGNAANTIQTGAQGTDKSIIDNKVAAATAFTTALDTTAEIVGYAGASSALQGQVKAWLSSVTDQASSLTAAKDALLALTTTVASGAGGSTTGQTFTLTTGQDVFNGNAGADILRGVAGQAVAQQDQTTLNSSDVLDGAAGEDALVVLLNGNYGGGATIKNIETLQIGTNLGGAATVNREFDYNINNGVYEVTGVNTVVYDQITQNETLNVVNVTPSATGNVIPTLKWDNEAGSVAGTAGVTFREASVAGTTTQLNIVLDDVNAGIFNIGGGVETIKVTSQGSTTNTLNGSANVDGSPAVDILSASEDGINNNGSLTKVIVDGARAFGSAAGIITTAGANLGLTNRAVGADGGFVAETPVTASNLISVAATVTEVDASASTGGVNVRFTPRVNGAEVAQVFKGGDGADYVEFEVGNVNATGGKGNDTFAFVNGGFNSTLTVADSLAGGEGTDTIQIGVNGAASAGQQAYTLDWTEFNNKTGIDVLDLRGNTNTVTLSDTFVAASDAGLLVRTDKIVQTSATDSANPATSTARQEDNSVNTINLTKLSAGRAITVEGGSGSDRLVVNEQSLTASTVVRGGTNVGDNGTPAVAGDYDTITVIDNAVLSRGDLSNVSGIEAIALVKSDNNSARQFSLEITQSFLTANTLAADVVTTSTLNDTVFSIVTGAAGNANTLAAGDTVTIDVSDLYTGGLVAGGLKSGIGARTIDVSSLRAAGANVVYRDASGVIAAPAVITGSAAVAASADAAIALGSAALVAAAAPAVPLTAGGTFTGTAGVNDTFRGTQASLTGTTVTGTAADTETLTLTDAGTVAIPATVTNIDVLNLANGTNVITGITAAGVTTVNGGTGNDTVTANAAGMSFTGNAGNDTYISAVGATLGAAVISGGDGLDTLTLVTGDNISAATISGIETLTAVGANSMTVAQYNSFNAINSVGGADNLTLTTAGTLTVNFGAGAAGFETIALFNGTNDLTATETAAGNLGTATITGGTGTDTLRVGFNYTPGADAALVGVENIVLTATGTTLSLANQTEAFTVTGFATGANVITGGAGADTITGGTGIDDVTGGAGADRIDLGTGSADIVRVASAHTGATAGVTASAAVPAQGVAINASGLDIITNFSAGDTIVLTQGAASTVAATTYNLVRNAGTLGANTTNDAALLQGNYDAATGLFTVNAAGNSTLLAFDSNGVAAGGAYVGVVLVGYVDVGGLDTFASAAGVTTGATFTSVA